MDLKYTEDDLLFREEVRAFISEAFTPDLQQQMARSKNGYMGKDAHVSWQKRRRCPAYNENPIKR